jgi:hypothetical protein
MFVAAETLRTKAPKKKVSGLHLYTLKLDRCSDELRARKPGFDSGQRQEIYLLHSAETGPGAHPVSYPMGKAAGA